MSELSDFAEDIEVIETDIIPGQRKQGRVIRGNDCEYIKIASIVSNSGCSSGSKFVIKQQAGVRKQFLIMNGEAILAFVNKGKKFTACDSYTEVTSSVVCKVVSGLADVDITAAATAATTTGSAATASTASSASATATSSATTTAVSSANTTASATATAASAANTTAAATSAGM